MRAEDNLLISSKLVGGDPSDSAILSYLSTVTFGVTANIGEIVLVKVPISSLTEILLITALSPNLATK